MKGVLGVGVPVWMIPGNAGRARPVIGAEVLDTDEGAR